MAFQDFLIISREIFLQTLLGIRPSEFLNNAPLPSNDTPIGMEIAAELKQVVNHFKAVAMDEMGVKVDYSSLAQSDPFLQFRAQSTPKLRLFDPVNLNTREEKLAFWINLYNALIIDGVIHFGVKDSVAKGLGVLRFFRQVAYNVGGQRMTAEDIEHGILRANQGNPYLPGPQFSSTDPRLGWALDTVDPRVHFALNCASKSCPPIGVYTPERIDAQLELAAQNYVSHEVHVDRAKGEIQLSPIFKWYQVDFGEQNGVMDFISRFLPDEISEGVTKLRFGPYDWGLNV